MRLFTVLIVGALMAVAASQTDPGKGLSWAFPVPDEHQPAAKPDTEAKHLAGSTKAYTQQQIDDQFLPPDWFPDQHAPAPKIVQYGIKPNVQGCGSCHLMSGMGHPESALLAGLPYVYMERQMIDFKSGERKDPPEHLASLRAARMNGISKAISPEDSKAALEWFAALKPEADYYTVVEAKTVPKTYVNAVRMRLVLPEASGIEPIGNRMIVLPKDQERVELRDPHSGFNVYVPPGSLAKGKALVMNGGSGKTISCTICHGDNLKGLGEIPGLAGQNPLFVARQLYNFKSGAHTGTAAALMKKVVANLGDEDMLAIAAYVTSLHP
jgi:cytochrome c553